MKKVDIPDIIHEIPKSVEHVPDLLEEIPKTIENIPDKVVEAIPDKVAEKIPDKVVENAKILTRRETIKYIISCVLLGSLCYTTKKSDIGSMQITFLRVFIGTFFLMTVFCCSKNRATLWDYTIPQLIYLVVSGVCIGLSWLILAHSGTHLGTTIATMTYSLGPGLLLIVSPFLFKDTDLTPVKVIGFVICTMGVFMIDWQYLTSPHSLDILSDVIIAAFFTVVIVYCNRKLENINGLENAMFQMVVAFLVILVVYVVRHGLYFEIPYPDSWWILLAGVLNTGLPVYLYLSSIDDLRPDIIAFAGYIRPLTTLFISVVFYNEVLSQEAYVGICFILGGVAVANMFRRNQLTKSRTF